MTRPSGRCRRPSSCARGAALRLGRPDTANMDLDADPQLPARHRLTSVRCAKAHMVLVRHCGVGPLDVYCARLATFVGSAWPSCSVGPVASPVGRPMSRPRQQWAMLTGVVLLLAGCDAGDDEPTPSTWRRTSEEPEDHADGAAGAPEAYGVSAGHPDAVDAACGHAAAFATSVVRSRPASAAVARRSSWARTASRTPTVLVQHVFPASSGWPLLDPAIALEGAAVSNRAQRRRRDLYPQCPRARPWSRTSWPTPCARSASGAEAFYEGDLAATLADEVPDWTYEVQSTDPPRGLVTSR
jgi:hypothetical protein